LEHNYSLYLVALVDILGQRDKLFNLPLPQNGSPQEIEEVKRQLRDTAGAVLRIRKDFRTSFELSNKPGPLISQLPEKEKKIALDMNDSGIRLFGFSDSVVISLPITSKYNFYSSVVGINACLYALCSVFMASFANGHPIRGGVDIGPCITLESKNEVYGAAVESAHYLESKVAEFPRIAVGNRLMAFLENILLLPPSGLNISTIQFAQKARKLIDIDSDGCIYLDYLSKEFVTAVEDMPNDIVFSEMMRLATANLERFRNSNQKLFSRYEKMIKYIELKKLAFDNGKSL
jgi:hypothetical protein